MINAIINRYNIIEKGLAKENIENIFSTLENDKKY